jgi:ABC-2 type transport system permease protein
MRGTVGAYSPRLLGKSRPVRVRGAALSNGERCATSDEASRMLWRRIRHIIKKEFIQVRRDPRMLSIIMVAPLFQLIIFGYAATTDIKHVSTAVLDNDRSRQSRDLIARFVNSGYFDLDHYVSRPQDIPPLLDSGEARIAIEIPVNFAQDLAAGKSATLQVVFDGTDSTTAGTVLGYVTGIVQRFSQDVLAERAQMVQARLVRVPSIEERTRVWYNPDLKSVNFMVPGVVCLILLVVTMIMTSLAIVKEREIGTLEQLIVTPIRPVELMIAKTIPFVIIGYVDVLLILFVARMWFRVPIAGSAILLLALTGTFLLTSLGLGLFISTVSRTQQQAQMTSFFIMMPSMILSGFIFPIENMPHWVQVITYAIPLRYFLTIVREIFLKGSGMAVLWPQVLALLGLGIAILALSAARFVKRMA